MIVDMDRRGDATKLRIIEVTEQLVGVRGAEVSVREITKAAGCSNMSAVNYHFGGKEQLLQAVLLHRSHELEAARSRTLIEVASANRISDTRVLIDAFFKPLASMVDRRGHRRFAAYILALEHANMLTALRISSPVTDELVGLIQKSLPGISPRRFEDRFRLAGFMFICGLVKLDRRRHGRGSLGKREEQLMLRDLFDMAHGSVMALQPDEAEQQLPTLRMAKSAR